MTIHHKKPTVMRLKPTNGEFTTTDAENVSVMGQQFEKFYRNHWSVDWLVPHELPQRHFMIELNTIISWKELKQAVTKLSNGKSPGLNDLPPNAFKALDKQIYLT